MYATIRTITNEKALKVVIIIKLKRNYNFIKTSFN